MIPLENISEQPLVSVIVPTRNSSEMIDACLASVRLQTYPNIEIIVVDNHSSDDTQRIAKHYGKAFVKGPERSVQRNYGAKNAKGKYLFFVDSDMELTKRVVEECVKEAEEAKASAVVIPDQISVGIGFWANCRALERACFIGDEIDHRIEAARFFLKDVFWVLGGYDESITGIEDWDMSRRVKEAGYKASKIKSFIRHHEGDATLTTYVKKAYYYAKNSAIYFDKYRKMTMEHVVLSKLVYLRNLRNLARKPKYPAGMFFMNLCEYIAAAIGYFVGKLG